MKRNLWLTCALAICSAPMALADENGNEKKKQADVPTQVVISTVEIATEEGEAKPSETKASGKVIVEINGESHEIAIGQLGDGVAKKIQEVVKKKDQEAKIETSVIGHVVIVGPDGEKKEFKFGDPRTEKEMLKNLPEEVRIRVEKAMKDSKGALLGQGIMIGPDGVKKTFKLDTQFDEALKNLPEDARQKIEQALKGVEKMPMPSSGGRAIVIGPDGMKKEFKFGEGNLDEDLKVLGDLPRMLQLKVQRSEEKSESSADKSTDVVAQKLEVIMKRLDKIEKEIQALKKAE